MLGVRIAIDTSRVLFYVISPGPPCSLRLQKICLDAQNLHLWLPGELRPQRSAAHVDDVLEESHFVVGWNRSAVAQDKYGPNTAQRC